MTLKKPARLMNLPKSWSTDGSANRIVNFAFVSNLPVGEESNLKQNRANIPIAKPCVYTSTRVYRGISCFPSIASGI